MITIRNKEGLTKALNNKQEFKYGNRLSALIIGDNNYHIMDYNTLLLVLDKDNRVVYFDNRILCADMGTFLKVLAEAYNLDRDFRERKEYIEGAIDLLRGQQEVLGYIVGGERDNRDASLAGRTIRAFFNNKRELTLIKLANRDVFFNPNSFFLESARITLYLRGSLAFSTDLKNLIKQEVSQ